MRSLDKLEPRRIVIVKPSALGDIVHALPVLTALRQHYPQAHLSWIVNAAFQDLLVGHPHLDSILTFDRNIYRGSRVRALQSTWRFSELLRKKRFDLVIDLQGLLRTGIMTAATGAPIRVGFANAREGSRRFYTHRVPVPDADRIHAVQRYWRVLEALGVRQQPMTAHVPIVAAELEAARAALANLPRPWIAVAAGAKWVTKRWPPEHFALLLNRCHAEFGGSALLVGAKDDIELSQQITLRIQQPCLDLTGKTSLARLVAVLHLADLMLANDTGPLHLAAALGKPCIAPYLCTKVLLHGPFGVPGCGVETTVHCAGSYLKKCPNQYICFQELSPDRLWQPMQEVMKRWVQRYPSA